MPRRELFTRLREIATERLTDDVRSRLPDTLVPIQQTVDGWFCVDESGTVVHVLATDGAADEVIDYQRATALIGCLSRRCPLASFLLPRPDDAATICPGCQGTGVPSGAPDHLLDDLVCTCGGLGWLSSAHEHAYKSE
jgi:hypothetical protein